MNVIDMKERITITISSVLLRKIDTAHGILNRSTYLEELLKNMNMLSAILANEEGMSKPAGGFHEKSIIAKVTVIVSDFLAFVLMHTQKNESQEYQIFVREFWRKIEIWVYNFLCIKKRKCD